MRAEFNSRAAGTKTPDDIVIFLDLDGVLADFDSHMHARGKADGDGKPKWNELDHEWWTSIPVFHGAKKFYHDLKALGLVKFLSAPVPGVDSFSGKAEWLSQSFLPKRGRFATLDLILCAGKDKRFLAAAGRILVDDRMKNIKEWEEAGGIGVHHKGDFAQTLAAVKRAIDDFRDGGMKSGPSNSPSAFVPGS